MKSIAQLFRQPIKTLLGILLVALAVATLCVCIGQAGAANNMRASLDDSYYTVALPANKYLNGKYPQRVLDWIDEAVAENPELILEDSWSGLASAWISELHPDNYTDYLIPPRTTGSSNAVLSTGSKGAPYTCAMLEITLKSVETQTVADSGSIIVTFRGNIERVVGLEQGYNDPTGYGAILTMTVPGIAEWEEMADYFVVGQRYLTYGIDYTDYDWDLRRSIATSNYSFNGEGFNAGAYAGFQVDRFLPENLKFMGMGDTEEEWAAMVASGNGMENVAYYRQDYINEKGEADYYLECITAYHMVNAYNKVGFTICDFSTVIGNDKDKTPTIVRLDDTLEEFLSSDEGSPWRSALDSLAICNQAFPVVGVDHLMYVADFARQHTVITEGRIFSQEELNAGSKVCVISETLAQKNGLTVGDTLTMRFYNYDANSPHQSYISQNQGIINLAAYYYTPNTPFQDAAEVYTIVGIYSQKTLWDESNENLYAFTPNTIFAPKSSITADMDYSYMGMFRSLVLPNGGVDDFLVLLGANSMDGLFICYDQGYTKLANNLYAYDQLAGQALRVGLIVYAAVILLYFLLFPKQQGKAIAIMAALGATRREKVKHICISCLGILIPGSIIGTITGILLRQRILDMLIKSAAVVLPLKIDAEVMILIGALQLLLTGLLTLIVAIFLTRQKSLIQTTGVLDHLRFTRKVPLYTWAVTLMSLVISLVLCSLHASNEKELENFQTTRRNIPITVTVTNLQGDQATGLNLAGWVKNIFSGNLDWGLTDYLTDIRIEFSQPITTINGQTADRNLQSIKSISCAPELLPLTDSTVLWHDGFDATIFEGNDPVCIVPADYTADADPTTPEQEVALYFSRTELTRDSMGAVVDSRTYEYECSLKVVGSYVSSLKISDIYCPYSIGDNVNVKLATTQTLDSASATLKDNDQLEEFRAFAARFFEEPNPNAISGLKESYALKIDVDDLEKAEAVLNNSITINRLSTLLVFLLTACSGFFVGFLMIRGRKKEILLMRTLGKPNASVYQDFALEQMGYLILGTLVGGSVFMWKPITRLALFVLIYFVGLTTALLIFLNSKLITGMKEDE